VLNHHKCGLEIAACHYQGGDNDYYDLIYVKSSSYNCNTMLNAGSIVDDFDGDQLPSNGFFRVHAGLYGKPAMNFYKRSNGNWEYYQDNGQKQGDCYPLNNFKWCSIAIRGASMGDHMWCTGAC